MKKAKLPLGNNPPIDPFAGVIEFGDDNNDRITDMKLVVILAGAVDT